MALNMAQPGRNHQRCGCTPGAGPAYEFTVDPKEIAAKTSSARVWWIGQRLECLKWKRPASIVSISVWQINIDSIS
jgi:hypothetical protein